RMRPDRIIVGEIRRERQAEVLFEAMHTGHSVYSTLHADTAEQTIRRLINPPINVPKTLMEAVDLNVVMYRDRRENIRRVMQLSEVLAEHRGDETTLSPNVMYRWRSEEDEIVKQNDSSKLFEQLKMHAGLSRQGIQERLAERKDILQWMVDNDIDTVDRVGRVVAEFYQDPDRIVDAVEDDDDPDNVL
ncbi:MAG: ATPase, T2SS/T4P/T4SS family, partial [Candidatus Nanohaloarchaea archaeon]